MGPRFVLKGFEPAEVKAAPNAQRRAYWEAVSAFVAEAKEAELKAGLDRKGDDMVAIAASTRKNRHSEMGPADPFAPPLQPAHGLSRTRALFVAQPTRLADGVTCFWSYDAHTGASWGEILRHHRKGGKHLPVRDVIGLSPVSLETVRTRALHWWRSYIHGVSEIPTPTRELMPTPAPEFMVRTIPKYKPGEPADAVPKSRRRVSQIEINGHVVTLQSGSAAQERRMIANRTHTGFRKVIRQPDGTFKAYGIDELTTPMRGKFTQPPRFGPKPPPAPPKPIPPRPTPLPHATKIGLVAKPRPAPAPPPKPAVPKPAAAKGRIAKLMDVGVRVLPASVKKSAAWLIRKLYGAKLDE
jgi:hypothetical protein